MARLEHRGSNNQRCFYDPNLNKLGNRLIEIFNKFMNQILKSILRISFFFLFSYRYTNLRNEILIPNSNANIFCQGARVSFSAFLHCQARRDESNESIESRHKYLFTGGIDFPVMYCGVGPVEGSFPSPCVAQ